MNTFTLSNTDIKDFIASINEEMVQLCYTGKEMNRYALLMEEALIKWQEAFGSDTTFTYEIREHRRTVQFIVSAKGTRVYPFDQGNDDGTYLSRMHDRLLSGTGCEFQYSYWVGQNKLTLRLPKEQHEKQLFYYNMQALAIPVAFQYLMTTAITATDSILMGLLDQSSLSAISMTGAFIELFNILMTALVSATTIFASQCWGKRDREGISRILRVSLLCSGFFGLVFFLPSFFAPSLVMSLYSNIPELIEKGSEYLRLVSPMFLFSAFYQIYYAIMKNTGKVMRCAVVMVTAAIVDCGLNIVMVFGYCGFPKMGMRGAALGTVIAAGMQLVICLVDCLSSRDVRLFVSIPKEKIRNLFTAYVKKAFSVGAQMVSWTLANNIVTSIFGHMGSEIVAANGVVNIISEMGIFACAGLYNTCGIMVGSKLGNNQLEQGKLYSQRYVKTSVILGGITCIGVLILAVNIRILPFSLSNEAFRLLQIMLYVVAFELMAKSVNCTMNNGGFYAGGDTFALLVIDSINMWLIMVPMGLLCLYVLHFPPIIVAIALHFDEFTSLPFKLHRYRKYIWVRNLNEE